MDPLLSVNRPVVLRSERIKHPSAVFFPRNGAIGLAVLAIIYRWRKFLRLPLRV